MPTVAVSCGTPGPGGTFIVIANCSTSYEAGLSSRIRAHTNKGWFGLDPAFGYRGNRGMREKHVRVRAMVSDSALVLEVADEGTGFDLDACTIDPTSPGNLEREDGRGLFLMRSLMDRVERYADDAHNVVRLTLNRS